MKLPDNVNIDDEDFLYLTFNNVDGYLMKNDGIKYLVFNSTDENKEALKKNYTELWKENKKQIEAINDGKPIKYRKDFMRIRFESVDDLPWGKTLNISEMIIVLEKNGKYYPQIFLDKCLYEL